MRVAMTRRAFPAIAALLLSARSLSGQESADPARLGILLDHSEEMGFLVPQVRKELRVLNGQLADRGRSEVILREMPGSSLEREGPSTLGATKNAWYALRDLYAGVDTVMWITALKGRHSSEGIEAVETLLKEAVPGRPPRRLLLRNVWADQLIAGDEWVGAPPVPEDDPLDLRNRPEEWYRLIGEGRGIIVRSWQVPPPAFREGFGFPPKVVSFYYLKKLGFEGREAAFDRSWALSLERELGLTFQRLDESWPSRITGRRWIEETTLLPFTGEEELELRNGIVLGEMTARDSIDEDLSRIEGDRVGVVFALGYVKSDLERAVANRAKEPRGWREHYLADLMRIGGECSRNQQENRDKEGRIYANVRLEFAKRNGRPDGPDEATRAIARLAREEKVPAVYLFTNGYVGGGDYGTWTLDLPLLALAIKDSGTRLFIRVPFEFGPVPLDLARLAIASGGAVFQGKSGDADWEMPAPSGRWP